MKTNTIINNKIDTEYGEIKIPNICPVCCTLRSIMIKDDRLECSRCDAYILFKDVNNT